MKKQIKRAFKSYFCHQKKIKKQAEVPVPYFKINAAFYFLKSISNLRSAPAKW